MGRSEIIIPYAPRLEFMPFHRRTQRWACLVAHRRAGKTVASINDLVRDALTCKLPRPHCGYISPFLRQSKGVAWDYLVYYTREIATKVNVSELSVTLPNEGRVSLFGADNADALRGYYFDKVLCDEYGDFRPSVFGNVIRPALADRQGGATFIGTPKGKNQFWEVREIARKNPAEWYLLELPASRSSILPQEEIDAARSQLSEDQFLQEFECSFEAAIMGAFYGTELRAADRDGRIGSVPHDPERPVFTCWDLGYRDDTAIWWFQVILNEIHWLESYAASGQEVRHYVDVVQAAAKEKGYRYATHYLPHDARAKTLAAQGKSIIEQLAEHLGKDTLQIVPELGLQDGIQAARRTIARSWFDAEGCEFGLEALRQYQREYDEDKKAFRERPRHDWTSHLADAFRMGAVAYEVERPKIEEIIPPVRGWGVGGLNIGTLDDAWKDHHVSRRI